MTPREHIGRQVLVFEEVDSTNTVASAYPPGTAVIAMHQTSGRGRFGRTWTSRPGSSLLLSVLLSPPPELRRPSILTAWAAVAIGDAIFKLTGLQARIKWPNDLLIRGKKVGGILIEQGVSTIVGIGLNLNQSQAEFDAAELSRASSLELSSGKPVEHRRAAETVLMCLDAEYSQLLSERTAVEAQFQWRIGLLGRQVSIELSDGSRLVGRLHEMTFDGLDLELGDGSHRRIVPERVEHVDAVH